MITDEKLFDVAVSYHIKGKLQREIAEELGVSRVQISKYLSLAQERGIVGVSVIPPWVEDDEEEKYRILFKKFFGIEKLILTAKRHHENRTYTLLVEEAARYLFAQSMQKPCNVGVGWGRTIFDLSMQRIGGADGCQWTIAPLAISSHSDDEYFDFQTITENFNKNWGTKTHPSLLQIIESKTAYEQHMDAIISHWSSLDMLIFGIGMPFTRYPGARTHLFSRETLEKLRSLDITGDIINNFFDIDGNIFIPKVGEPITIPYNIIQNVANKVAVASGCQKIPSIIGACRSGLVDTLITDIQTARRVMEYLD
ncbi:MAG TPA: sugar-binding domain-containing protein [Sphaerochaeta sp.]|nr:sugar-binding domain-containing protein [Sphaerochaeta sp.]